LKQNASINLIAVFISFALLIICIHKGVFDYKNPNKYTLPFLSYHNAIEHKKEMFLYKNIQANRKVKNTNYKQISEKEVFVVVIGESANREHLGIYGYDRDTTPYLNSIKDELYLYNGTSPSNGTVESLKKSLTPADENDFLIKDTILNTINDTKKFKTFWIANQGNGKDNLISELANSANYVYFQENYNKFSKHLHDEIILQEVYKAIDDNANKKFIFIHLYGSHLDAKRRYPKEFERWSGNTYKEKQVAHYDNSILYTDYILNKIISKLKNAKTTSYLLYFSDHGTDIRNAQDSCLCRDKSKYSYDAPVILWSTKDFSEKRKKEIRTIKKEIETKYLYDIILSISGIVRN
jgi:heptose-I-phosphate ethanolaminephosphotransferase